MVAITRRFSHAVAITKSDTTLLPSGTVGLYVGTGGTLVLDFGYETGETVVTLATDVTFLNFPSGQGLADFQILRVKAATGASNILALIGR
jgi:hypothetical protein